MTDEQTLAYVQAASVAVALPLNDAQAQRVATHLQRTAALAALLDNFELDVDDEPAEIYCPAPFLPSQH
ncbi:DUF4089 domain-containing protein [Hydrogenophaga sp.]|uniref:DUF4089 domain-containing protein n=1 Tax=Hydrogenophaga sp. TaxID=1904254 RepID=UPI002730AAA8|nr:DUF4089 domain-containing protein [Hydrogenophaga sp.]MDP2015764.1 DUF4089 domain-containing protein [Hydrogenophaga sp.]MDP3167442.1 DUF4089 domain-containing protein [Hydrogenophaga sp.]MDP3809580.1 DUF4089 domain-containing protein [Hydrogenophaga sp.]